MTPIRKLFINLAKKFREELDPNSHYLKSYTLEYLLAQSGVYKLDGLNRLNKTWDENWEGIDVFIPTKMARCGGYPIRYMTGFKQFESGLIVHRVIANQCKDLQSNVYFPPNKSYIITGIEKVFLPRLHSRVN